MDRLPCHPFRCVAHSPRQPPGQSHLPPIFPFPSFFFHTLSHLFISRVVALGISTLQRTIMSRVYASSFLRQATASLVPTAARPLRCSSAQSAATAAFHARRSRCYSTQSEGQEKSESTSSTSEASEGEKKDGAASAPSAEEEFQRKLKAKEDEVVDLTVR